MQLTTWHFIDTIHTRLFITSNQCLYNTMLQGLIFHDSHDSSNTDTIIGTKGGIVRINPSIHDMCDDRIGLKVMFTIWSLLWNHIHVSLQQNRLAVFISWCGRLTHNDIAASIDIRLNTYSLSKV